MSYLIKMPQMGLEMEEGEVVAWEVDEGEAVETGDIIAVVESEKAANDVEAREDGVVREIVVSEGSTVEPGEPMGILAGPDEDIADLQSEVDNRNIDESAAKLESTGITDETNAGPSGDRGGSSNGKRHQAAEAVRATPGAKQAASEHGVDLANVDGSGPQGTITEADVAEQATAGDPDSDAGDVRATPGAKQVASDRDIDLSAVDGSGPQGVITEADVVEHEPADAAGAAEVVETAEGRPATRTIAESRTPSGVQRTVGNRMSESYRTAPHVTLNWSVDASAMLNVVDAADRAGVDISLTDLLLAGVGAELAETPEINALYEDGEHKLVQEINVGIAVDIEDGLVTPVVPSVAERSIESIAETRGALTDRALSGAFEMSDMAGGTFTVTNLGMFGVDSFDPIINPPEVAILGVGRVRDDGTMTLSLSFDHRVVNGADGARFLDGAVERLTDARWLADRFEADVLGALVEILSE